MELLKNPRSTYRHARSDDFEPSPSSTPLYELSEYRSISSFPSTKSTTPAQRYDSDYHLLGDSTPKRPDQKRSRWTIRFEGWRKGASTAAVLALFSMLINLAVAFWLAALRKSGAVVEVYNGSCDSVTKADVWVHLAINVLSTLLLGGSNFCMQCLAAPTRKEIDRFHAQGKYLDIGVPSVRNLRAIPRSKVLLWWALGLSSIPLHLMYNSAFFKSLVTNDYNILTVTEDFVNGATFNNSWYDSEFALYGYRSVSAAAYLDANIVQQNISEYIRLDPTECLRSYATSFLSDKRQLVIVVDKDKVDREAVSQGTYFSFVNMTAREDDPLVMQESAGNGDFYWICGEVPDSMLYIQWLEKGDLCDRYYRSWFSQMENWKPFGQEPSYCLYEPIPERCSYSASIPIISIVIVSNFVKLVCMYVVATRLRDSPLITVGDALESFLNTPDPHTKDMCLLNRATARNGTWANTLTDGDPLPTNAALPPLRWTHAATPRRWAITMSLFTLAVMTALGLFVTARTAPGAGMPAIGALGLGRIDVNTLIKGWDIDGIKSPAGQIMAAVLVANLPQTILSFLYVHLNGLATSMWLAMEYSDFAHERKALRVSHAKGDQRSTHFLQLPYKIALPLMGCAGVLHWLLSQSIFLAVVAQYGMDGELVSQVSVATCGYSPLGMLLTMTMALVLVAVTIAVGWFRWLKGGIPLAGSCSAAISAACHRPVWDDDASLKPVMWGVIKQQGLRDADYAHCSFSSGDVSTVEEGKIYAGWVSKRRGHASQKESACAGSGTVDHPDVAG